MIVLFARIFGHLINITTHEIPWYKISVTGGYFTPAPVLISRFRGLSWMGLGLTPVGVGLEVCVVVIVVVVVVTMIKGEYTSSCVPLSYRTIL